MLAIQSILSHSHSVSVSVSGLTYGNAKCIQLRSRDCSIWGSIGVTFVDFLGRERIVNADDTVTYEPEIYQTEKNIFYCFQNGTCNSVKKNLPFSKSPHKY